MMLLKSQSPMYQAAGLVTTINRIRYRSPSHRAKLSPKSSSKSRKRCSPKINHSFAAYEESSPSSIKLRSTSVDRTRHNSIGEMKSVRSRHTTLRSVTKISDILENLEVQIEIGRQAIKDGNFSQAVEIFQGVLEKDRGNFDALYGRAISYMHLQDHKSAVADLLIVAKENPVYDRQLYTALSMCFIAMNDISTALRLISKGLSKFPRFAEGYVVRGQIYLKQEKNEKALCDFKQAIAFNPKDGSAYLGVADCLSFAENKESCLEALNKAISCPETSMAALLKRAKFFSSLDKNDQALDDLNKYISYKSEDSEAYFDKASLLLKTNQFNEAALCFEQVIKYDQQSNYSNQAVFHLGALKIRERDYYGALHTFKRTNWQKEIKDQKTLRHYAEAVINLMKRKYKEGIAYFTKLIKSGDNVIQEYLANCYAYRAYGYCALNKHDKALQDFKKASLISTLNKASLYNQNLAHGLWDAKKGDFQAALKHLNKAHKHFPKNPDPLIYHAAILLHLAYKASPHNDLYIIEAEELLEKAFKLRDPESDIYYYKSIIKYLGNKLSTALEDAKLAIDKAEENVPEHYVLRGLIQAALHSYEEALQDFTIAIQLNEELHYANSYRARVAYLSDDTELAYSDFQKHIVSCPDDREAHINLGNLLMSSGSYDDAINAFNNALVLDKSLAAAYQKTKCYILLNKIDEAIDELNKILQLDPNSTAALKDKEISVFLQKIISEPKDFKVFLNAIEMCNNWLNEEFGEIFEKKNIHWMKGIFLMYTKEYGLALDEFQEALEIIHSKETLSMTSDEALAAEEENCEILYNIGLCHLFYNKEQSLVIFQDLSEVLNNKHKGQMLFLSALSELSLGNNEPAEKLLQEAFKCDPETISPFLNDKPTLLLPLNTNNSFSSNFPLITLPFSNIPQLEARPAISLPRVRLPSFEFQIEEKVKEFFDFTKILPKPEAPWLNRVRGSIQFTENIVEFDIDPSDSDEEKEKIEDKSTNEISDNSERKVKSLIPIRHKTPSPNSISIDMKDIDEFNSGSQNGNKEMAPKHILQKIKDVCKAE
ncbi:unnamed protein product [Blepharisma stoltei]|uniref:Uncharacterized protein n=1 Tax=Blepharisma stoltei TaxID=1481888 RepID=A0AAU9JQH4_9CILI|nr:unnamed protein product [Blepharisma stoltei]